MRRALYGWVWGVGSGVWEMGRTDRAESIRIARSATPDGVTYGSRWSERSERPPEHDAPNFTTAAAVAEGIHAAWYLIRDPAGVGLTIAHVNRRSLASLGPPATV